MKASRAQLGLKQSDLAEIGGIARATQISYESGVTEPTTAYLRAIQGSGIDLPLILYGRSKDELDSLSIEIDWPRLQQAHEDVEFFCQRFAPQCPASYRWQMVRQLYQAPVKVGERSDGSNQSSPMTTLSEIWARYAAG